MIREMEEDTEIIRKEQNTENRPGRFKKEPSRTSRNKKQFY